MGDADRLASGRSLARRVCVALGTAFVACGGRSTLNPTAVDAGPDAPSVSGGQGGAPLVDAGTTPCAAGQERCFGICTDVASNPQHCGVCSNSCPDGEACVLGVCSTSCNECGGGCVDTDTDPSNCGACDRPCEAGQVCVLGRCRQCSESLLFSTPPSVSIGTNAIDVEVADFNADGRADVAVVGYFQGTFVVLTRSDGTFDAPVEYGHPDAKVDAADLDLDGDIDLFGTSYWDDSVTVLENRGDGSFEAGKSFRTASFPTASAAADLNQDGTIDLVVKTQEDHDFALLFNRGGLDFADAVYESGGISSGVVRIADVDEDGRNDLLMTRFEGNSLSLLLGTASGSFDRASIGLPGKPSQLKVADLDQDGHIDLVVSIPGSDVFVVFRGHGDGSFDDSVDYPAGPSPTDLEIAHFDADANLDLVVVNHEGASVSAYAGNGDGTFSGAQTHSVGSAPAAISAGDISGDGLLDLAVADFYDNFLRTEASALSVLLGKGDGTFRTYPTHDVGEGPVAIGAADLDKDGADDLVTANATAGSVSLLFGEGQALFARTDVDVGGFPAALALADFDLDGSVDIVVASNDEHRVDLLLASTPREYNRFVFQALPEAPVALAVGDVDGDTRPDVLVVTALEHLAVLIQSSFGTLLPPAMYSAGPSPRRLALGDIDADGDLDAVVAAANYDAQFTVLENTGGGSFAAPAAYPVAPADAPSSLFPQSVIVADLNRDTLVDIAVISSSLTAIAGNVFVRLNPGTGELGAPAGYPVGSGAAAGAVADFDGDGNLDIVTSSLESSTASLLFGRGDGSFEPGDHYVAGPDPQSISTGDFDGDGRQDIATAHGAASVVTLLLNEGLVCGYAGP